MNSESLLYERVAGKMVDLIADGTMMVGSRVPSIRQLKEKLGVSASTVVKAYFELERQGLIESRPQSGFYVKAPTSFRLKEPQPSLTLTNPRKVNVATLTKIVYETAYNPKIIPLGAAIPGAEVLPCRQLAAIAAAISKEAGEKSVSYCFPPGNAELRNEIALRTATWNEPLVPDRVLITSGAMEALNLCLRATTKPGDIVAVESPTYFGILQAIEELGLLALEIPAHPREGISLALLREAIRREKVAACLFTTSFNNPMGACIPDENKKELVRILTKKRIPLIEDDVYGDLSFSKNRPKTAKSFDTEGNVLLCSSFSKTLAPGYRIGWVSAGKFHDRVVSLKFTNTVASTTLPQLVVAKFLHSGAYDRHLREIRGKFKLNLDRAAHTISQFFPQGTKISRPDGGFVVWVELPKTVSSLELYELALKRRIGITPGTLFSARKLYGNCIRLNLGNEWSDSIEKGIATVGRLCSELNSLS